MSHCRPGLSNAVSIDTALDPKHRLAARHPAMAAGVDCRSRPRIVLILLVVCWGCMAQADDAAPNFRLSGPERVVNPKSVSPCQSIVPGKDYSAPESYLLVIEGLSQVKSAGVSDLSAPEHWVDSQSLITDSFSISAKHPLENHLKLAVKAGY